MAIARTLEAPAPERARRPLADHSERRGRFVALDGLRGIAALVVVLHHVYQIAKPFIEPHVNAWGVGTVWWLVSATPIKLLTAGSEAVLVFFVLSGLVVPLPALRRRGFSWSGFLAGRVIRLYVPVWASLLLAAAYINIIPRDQGNVTNGSWLAGAATQTHLDSFFDQASLTATSFSANSVLWSLQWEMIFSIALPLFVLLARVLRQHWLPVVVACFSMTLLAKAIDNDWLLYLPVFFVGTMTAVNVDRIRDWAEERYARRGAKAMWWGFVVVSALLVVVSWMARPIVHAGTAFSDALGSLTLLGAAGLVLAAIAFPPVEAALSSRVPQWLGRVSFSLYLVHLPILTTLAFALGDDRWWLVGIIGVPLSLVASWVFFRVVEGPSHRLAKLVGRFVEGCARAVTVRRRAARVRRFAPA